VGVVSLGGAGLGGLYGAVGTDDAVDTVCRAVELGVNYLDTSPFYGDCERHLSASLARMGGRPADLRLCTKVGTHPERYGDYSAEAARWTVEQSMRVVGVDYFDVVQVHALEGVDMDVVLAEGGAVDALEELKGEGRIGAIGLGVGGLDAHRRALDSGRFDVLLMYTYYTLLHQDALPVIEQAQSAGVGVLFGRALLVGLLAGSDPLLDPRLKSEPDAARAHSWWEWARDRELPLAAVALQFPMRHPGVSSVVVGASTPREIEASLAAASYPIPPVIWQEVDDRVAARM
jgi:aryl-alcohol dehydrogenase-like predicted oxidoreductase